MQKSDERTRTTDSLGQPVERGDVIIICFWRAPYIFSYTGKNCIYSIPIHRTILRLEGVIPMIDLISKYQAETWYSNLLMRSTLSGGYDFIKINYDQLHPELSNTYEAIIKKLNGDPELWDYNTATRKNKELVKAWNEVRKHS